MHGDSRAAAHRRRLTGLALALALVGCGGVGASGSGLSVDFEEATILDDSTAVAIYFYTDDGTAGLCNTFRAAVPRARSVLGPYRAELTAESKKKGLTFLLNDVPVGRWVVLADAVDANGSILGTGCAEGQMVYNRLPATIAVVIGRNP